MATEMEVKVTRDKLLHLYMVEVTVESRTHVMTRRFAHEDRDQMNQWIQTACDAVARAHVRLRVPLDTQTEES